ncbi:YSC84-related protein [Marinobacter sp. F4216]|uniref:lipid-binding SYLF domain-containing protein n=1 Tax=Marinobacter sp. F4216 TaxID=2874281 RepID=UPI001CBCB70F|nr:lipid-binding SYLF domain-containing protein [Marinobacter sp. F4216]MBZ2169736.1 lipid-binding SYLF domain-containing protein [Marinobacter sp. F4216]
MKNKTNYVLGFVVALAALVLLAAGNPAMSATAEDLHRDAQQALEKLYGTNEAAKALGKDAKAILVFPNIVKAGLVFGGSYGEGVLMKGSEVVDYYNSVTGTLGFQIGAQSYAYVMFLMSDEAVNYLETSQGWEVGVGPTVVMVDEGVTKNLSTSSIKDDAYAFIFSQQGLMAGVNIEGTKISRIQR